MRHLSRKVVLLCISNMCCIIFIMLFLQQSVQKIQSEEGVEKEPKLLTGDDSLQSLQLFADLVGDKINVCLIEPSLLWDLLSKSEQRFLQSKGFRVSEPSKVISLAVFADSLNFLTDVNTKALLQFSGFLQFEHTPGSYFSQSKSKQHANVRRVSHVLYKRHGAVLHVSVFYEREQYLWVWKLNGILPIGSVPRVSFGQTDSTFDRFQMVRHAEIHKIRNLCVPSNITKFLLQIETSRFIECQNITTRSTASNNETNGRNPPLWFFEQTTQSVIKEMRMLTEPSMTQFWLASGTLLGWYRDCGLIPYTSDLDFGSWATDLDRKLIERFETSQTLKLRSMLGKEKEDMEFWLQYKWLAVDLFFTYKNGKDNNFYVGAHRPEKKYSFKYIYPKFSLCSASFLGYRVLVPCDPEAVIEIEYGKDWRLPKKDWNYELSARNVLGRRYWDDDEFESFMKYRRH